MKRLTSKLVIEYHEYMSRKFHFEIIEKNDSEWMPFVANALELLGVMDKDKFMQSFALTIVEPFTDSKFVYIPWRPGLDSKGIARLATLRKQVMILAHEVEHTIQGEEIDWGPRYFVSKSFRANQEALAMHAELELGFYLTGKPLNTTALANRLKYYRVRSRDIRVTKKHLDLYNKIVARGAVGSEAGKAAIKWLKKRVK